MAALLRTDPLAPVPTEEVFGKVIDLDGKLVPYISYGLPFDKALVKHVNADAKVYVLASKTLCAKTDSLDRLKAAVGERFVGARIGMTPHTLFQECLEVIADVKAAGADTVVTLGGGSLADAAKLVCTALSNDIYTVEDLASREFRPAKLIMIPTTLSAGEHTPFAGVTDATSGRKYQAFVQTAAVTILDPWLCLNTPNSIWLQSGVRGIDHAVEMICSLSATQFSGSLMVPSLHLLVPSLLASARQSSSSGPPYSEADTPARLSAQLAVSLTVVPIMRGSYVGASHAIGHMLGPMGVGHGETSCVMLPAVRAWNLPANAERQAVAVAALWEEPECARLFEEKGLKRDEADLSALLDAVIRALGMPRNLREVNVVGEEKLRHLAELSMKDMLIKANPRPINSADDVMEILRIVEG